MDRCAIHLIANLYFTGPGMLFPVVLTTSLYMQSYLTGLSLLGIVPRVKIKRLKNRTKIEEYFNQLSRSDYSESLIVARNIYTNYYGLIKACSRSTKQIVVF